MPPCNKQQTIELDSTTWTALNELALAIHASRGVDMLQKETLEGTTGLVPHRIAMFDLIEAAGSDAPRYVHPASSGMDDRALSDYYNRYAAMDYTSRDKKGRPPCGERPLISPLNEKRPYTMQ